MVTQGDHHDTGGGVETSNGRPLRPMATVRKAMDCGAGRQTSPTALGAGTRPALARRAHPAIVTVDEVGRIVGWSDSARRLFGWVADDVLGRHFAEAVVTPPCRVAVTAVLSGVATGTASRSSDALEVVARCRSGEELVIDLALARAPGTIVVVARPAERHLRDLLALELASSRILAAASSLEDCASILLETLARRLRFSLARLWCANGDGRPVCAARWPALSAPVQSAATEAWGGDSLCARAWETRRIEVGYEPAEEGSGTVAAMRIEGIALPIEAEGATRAVVELRGGSSAEVDAATFDVLADLARQIGLVVERARTEAALRRTVEKLTDIAATDPLTGVRNRREFERVLGMGRRRPFALLAIDVDCLKPINDTYGHEAGDRVLQAVATTLESVVRASDLVARVGGDEFAVLLEGTPPAEAATIAERMRAAMHGLTAPFQTVSISVGWATGEAEDDARAVWQAADIHLANAKRHGRDRVVGGEGRTGPVVRRPPDWTTRLHSLLARRHVPMLFQPIVDLTDGRTVAAEALARPPGTTAVTSVEDLFRAAHRTGQVRDLDWLCRRMAVEQAPWAAAGWTLFLNVSTAALVDPVHDVDQLLLLLDSAGADPERVVLEITEREPIHDYERLARVLAAYREHGIRFAVDDIGEGHSTLELLAVAAPEFLKVARSLTLSPPRSGPHAAIRAIAAFARATGATVVAEGVEDEATAHRMRQLGIRLVQGFHFGLPASGRDFAARVLTAATSPPVVVSPARYCRNPHPGRRTNSSSGAAALPSAS